MCFGIACEWGKKNPNQAAPQYKQHGYTGNYSLQLLVSNLSEEKFRNQLCFFRELTLFWSKLLKRLAPSEQEFLDQCRQMSFLSKSVCHILFLIKVVQSEVGEKVSCHGYCQSRKVASLPHFPPRSLLCL